MSKSYQCLDCGKQYDLTNQPETCPDCGGNRLIEWTYINSTQWYLCQAGHTHRTPGDAFECKPQTFGGGD